MKNAAAVTTIVLMLAAAAAGAQERQSIEAIERVVERHLRKETSGLPGNVSYSIGPIDSRMVLAPCPAPEASAAPGSRPWGPSAVVVHCPAPQRWKIYVPVVVRVTGSYVTTARSLGQGHTISAADLVMANGDLSAMPAGTITDPQHAIGKTIAVGLMSGQPVREDMLRIPPVVQQGQSVQIVSRGPGFEVTSEGRALNNAGSGQIAQVRTASGRVVSGIARPGGIVALVNPP